MAEEKEKYLCECGCGRETNIIKKSSKNQGRVKGEHYRFIHGHNIKGKKMFYSEDGLKGKIVSINKLLKWHKDNPKKSKEIMENNWNNTVRKWNGKNHPLWLNGKSFELYGINFDKELKFKIRERDNFFCQGCGIKESEKDLCIHHIDYNKNNNSEYNLISLCVSCHARTNYQREKWMKYFQYIILIKYLEIYNIERGVLFNGR